MLLKGEVRTTGTKRSLYSLLRFKRRALISGTMLTPPKSFNMITALMIPSNPAARCFLVRLLPPVLLLGLHVAIARTAAPAKLTRIQVIGSKRVPEAEIVRASGLKLGGEVSPQDFQEAANKLAAAAVFTEINYRYTPSAGGISVEFRVSDASKFIPCKFTNFVWLSDEQLYAELRSRVPLFNGEVPPSGNLPEQIIGAMESLLKAQGVAGRVSYSLEGTIGGPIQGFQFRVEGIAIRILRVEFRGNTELNSSTLQAAVRPLIGTDFDQFFVRSYATRNVAPIYLHRGYLSVGFANPIAALIKNDPTEATVAVMIPVQEGLQYHLAEIHWSGNTVFSADDLVKRIHLLPGKPADAVQLQSDLESVQDLYGTQGYVQAVIQPKPKLEDAARTVNYELQVHEGDLYRMGKLEIADLDPRRVEAIKKSCRLKTGDAFDKSYWKTFFSEVGRYLPSSSQGWKTGMQQVVNQATKTVNVMLSFSPNTNR